MRHKSRARDFVPAPYNGDGKELMKLVGLDKPVVADSVERIVRSEGFETVTTYRAGKLTLTQYSSHYPDHATKVEVKTREAIAYATEMKEYLDRVIGTTLPLPRILLDLTTTHEGSFGTVGNMKFDRQNNTLHFNPDYGGADRSGVRSLMVDYYMQHYDSLNGGKSGYGKPWKAYPATLNERLTTMGDSMIGMFVYYVFDLRNIPDKKERARRILNEIESPSGSDARRGLDLIEQGIKILEKRTVRETVASTKKKDRVLFNNFFEEGFTTQTLSAILFASYDFDLEKTIKTMVTKPLPEIFKEIEDAVRKAADPATGKNALFAKIEAVYEPERAQEDLQRMVRGGL